jgi:hypothetical protein
VSGYASTDGRTCKPFNPLLGETYEADYPDKGLRFCSEKVTCLLFYIVGRDRRLSHAGPIKGTGVIILLHFLFCDTRNNLMEC